MILFIPFVICALLQGKILCTDLICPSSPINVTSTKGVLTFPPGDSTITASKTCTVVFEATKSVALKFIKFKFGVSGDCKDNYLEVGQGADSQVGTGQRFCGNTVPILPYSTQNKLYLVIQMLKTPIDDGFELEYLEVDSPTTQDCSKPISVLAFDNITWPPLDKMLPSDCTSLQQIAVAEGKRIGLKFITFRLPKTPGCSSNYIQIGSGETVMDSETKQCGNVTPEDKLFETNKIHMNMVMKDLPWGYLVQFQAREIGPLICQPELQATAAGTEVNIPGNEYFIPTGYNCTQVIKASAEKSIQLLFHDFQIGNTVDCVDSYVKIGLSPSPQDVSTKTFCGITKPDDTVYPGSAVSLMLMIKTPQNTDKLSFTAKEVETTRPLFKCEPNTYRATRIPNTLQIPSLDTVLPNNFSCDYVIEARIGKQVNWNFTKFKLGKTATDCSKHQVLISTNPDTDRPMIFCGPDLPRNYTNLMTRLVIKVTGSEFSSDDGFTLAYSSGATKFTSILTSIFLLIYGIKSGWII